MTNPALRAISLHHRVRLADNPNSANIRGYDYQFKYFKDSITEEDKNMFASILIKAELQEMKKARIILCTCSTAGSPRMTRKFANRWSRCESEVFAVAFLDYHESYYDLYKKKTSSLFKFVRPTLKIAHVKLQKYPSQWGTLLSF